ncbi:MAG: selenocysteine-specific translation elongation factor [Actinomycetota bacterium]
MHVLGTAGHVDHGKSTLIERLTGIDPDRLAEEKARGLTIDLGFAWLTLPSGREVGIVDVPGHERFVSNMLAGAGSIDATIFVVAANEGWKPQSEEHLAILDLLGARGGVVALTKSDLVGRDQLDATASAIAGRLEGTALEGAEVVPVSAATGDGLDELVAAIERMLDRTSPSPDLGRPRLFVDRSFSVKGAGTVVTGTLTGGRLRVGDEIAILPGDGTGRIRSIQTHKRDRDEAEPGSRVALNVAGLDRSEIRRGDAAVHPGRWRPTTLLDVWMRPVRGLGRAVGARGAFKLHVGSAEVDARLRWIEAQPTEGGEGAFARLTLGEEIIADAFDRFVLRDSGRSETVAGGEILDPHPARRPLGAAERSQRITDLSARRDAGREGFAASVIEERGVVAAADLRWIAGAGGPYGPLRGYAVSPAWLARSTESLLATLRAFHIVNPLARGMPREEARAAAGSIDPKVFAALLDALPDHVSSEGPLIRLATHRVTLSPEHQAARDRLIHALEAGGLAPPPMKELVATHGAPLVAALADSGEIVVVATDIVFAHEVYERARRAIADAVRAEGPLTASRIREVLGTTRKYLIPLLEHLDAVGFTKRSGDVRALADY